MLSRYVVSQVKHNGWFLVGLALGLWLAIVMVPLEETPSCTAPVPSAVTDDYEPQREERPDRANIAAGRAVQRPRYYSTELGMRAPLLAGVLAGAGAPGAGAGPVAAALNNTARMLQPALKFFITAGSRQASGGLANVVGFTDTREMLKPFHALKYLADNFLEEYDFFFLASDAAYINARRLVQLVNRLSVSQDVYMGSVAEDDSHYCSLESGVILSNSVLRAVHTQLDWCVRNSYSPHHHENLGRCVLHAAHVSCTTSLQGESFVSVHLSDPPSLTPALAAAVTAYPVSSPTLVYQLHAYVSRAQLERSGRTVRALRLAVTKGARRHPAGFRNATWPGGLRSDPGLAQPPPDSRFDYTRWIAINRTHAFMPTELKAVAPLDAPHKQALDAVWEFAHAWALQRWAASEAALVEGALRWEPAAALRYRLLLRLTTAQDNGQTSTASLRQIEVVRPLGAARLVPVPYVTESARLVMVLPVRFLETGAAGAFLQRYETVCLQKDRNTNLIIVLVSEDTPFNAEPLRATVSSLANKYHASLELLAGVTTSVASETAERAAARAARVAMAAAMPRLVRDALVLLADVHMEFNEDFLNRARMNSISGAQWFLPRGFARYATYLNPRVVAADGSKPQHHTGRFTDRHSVAAFYKADYTIALAEWTSSGGSDDASVPEILSRGGVRCLRAPEPGLVLQPAPQPCLAAASRGDCLAALRVGGLERLELGAKHALAKLLLEVQSELER